MELPIQIMIILFISIIIGGAVINFSQSNIAESQERLKEISLNDVESQEDRIIEITTISTNTVQDLSEQCFKDNVQSLESTICFAVLGSVTATCSSVIDNTELLADQIECNFESGGNAVKIYYNAPLGRVELS
jgi:hypothetical protein